MTPSISRNMNKKIDRRAEQGFAADAQAYDRGRPGYPREAITALCSCLNSGPAVKVIDLGAGTGKLTRLLIPHADVVAVEPVAAMRDVLAKSAPSTRVLAGSAEAIPLEDGFADAITVGQAFHWFSSAAALEEMHRVLKPHGQLGLIWNLRDESVQWVSEIMDTIRPFEASTPRYTSGLWKKAFENQGFFQLENHEQWKHTVPNTIADVMTHVGSISYVANLDAAVRTEALAKIEARLQSHFPGGQLQFPYLTDLWCYRRL